MPEYKGLTIKLEGDATSLSTALAEVSRAASVAQGNLTGINNALKFGSSNKLDLMRLQTENYGKAAKESYKRAFELASGFGENTKKLGKTKTALDSAKKSLKELTSTGRDFVADKKRYDELGKTVSDYNGRISKLQDSMEGMDKSSKKYANSQKRLSEYQAKVNEAEAERKKLYDSGLGQYNDLTSKVSGLSKEYEKLYANQQKMPVDFHTSIAQAEHMAAMARKSGSELEFQSSKAAKVSKALQSVGNTMENVGGSISKVSGRFASAGESLTMLVTLPLVGLGKQVGDVSIAFGNSMSQMSAYLDVPASKMAVLRNEALKFGQDTIFSAQEAAQAMIELAKGGLSEAQISGGALASTLNLAAAGGINLSSAAETIVTEMGAFNLTAKDSTAIANALAGGANASTAEVNTLADGLNNVGAVAQNTGWDIQDTVVALAALNDNGRKGATAGTDLKTMLMRLQAPTGKAKDLMEKYGISVRDANGHMKDLYSLADEFKDKLGKLNDKDRDEALSTIFGMRAINGMSILMDEGSKGLSKYRAAVNDSQAASKMAQAQLGKVGWAMENLRGTAETAAIKFGDSMEDVALDAIGGAQDALEWFSNLDRGTQKSIGRLALFAAAAGPVILVVGKIGQGVGHMATGLGKFIEFSSKFVSALGDMNSKSSYARQALQELGDGASNAATQASKLGVFKDEFGNAFTTVANDAESGSGRVAGAVEGMSSSVSNSGGIVATAMSKVKGGASKMVDGVSTAFDGVRGVAANAADKIVYAIDAVPTAFDKVPTAMDNMKTRAADAMSSVVGVASAGAGKFVGAVESFNERGVDAVCKMADGISSAGSRIKGALGRIADGSTNYATVFEGASSKVTNGFLNASDAAVSSVKRIASSGSVIDGLKSKFSSLKSTLSSKFGSGSGLKEVSDDLADVASSAPKAATATKKVGDALKAVEKADATESVAEFVDAVDDVSPAAATASSSAGILQTAFMNMGMSAEAAQAQVMALKAQVIGIAAMAVIAIAAKAWDDYTQKQKEAAEEAKAFKKATDGLRDAVSTSNGLMSSGKTSFQDYADGASQAAKSSKDLMDQIGSTADTIKERNKSTQDQIDRLQTAKTALHDYLNVSGLTTIQQGRLRDAVAEFNSATGMQLEVVDAANGKVKDSTGELTGEKDAYIKDLSAIDQYIEKKKQQARVDALTANLTDLYSKQSTASATLADDTKKLNKAKDKEAKATAKAEKAEKKYQDAKKKYKSDSNANVMKAASEYNDASAAAEKASKSVEKHQKDVDKDNKALKEINGSIEDTNELLGNTAEASDENAQSVANVLGSCTQLVNILGNGSKGLEGLEVGFANAGVSADELAKKIQENPDAIRDLANQWAAVPSMSTIVEWCTKNGVAFSKAAGETAAFEDQIKGLGKDVLPTLATGFFNAGGSIDDFVAKLGDASLGNEKVAVSFDTLASVGGEKLEELAEKSGYDSSVIASQLAGIQKFNLDPKHFTISDGGTIETESGHLINFNTMQIDGKHFEVSDDGTISGTGTALDGINIRKILDKHFKVKGDNNDAKHKVDEVNHKKTKDKTQYVKGDTSDANGKMDKLDRRQPKDKTVSIFAKIVGAAKAVALLAHGGIRKHADGGVRMHADGGIASFYSSVSALRPRYHADGGAIVDAPRTGYPLDLVGESGAEAIVPLTNKRYAMPFVDLIADELYKRIGGSSGVVYQINIDGARVNDDPAIRATFIDFMTELQRRADMNVG